MCSTLHGRCTAAARGVHGACTMHGHARACKGVHGACTMHPETGDKDRHESQSILFRRVDRTAPAASPSPVGVPPAALWAMSSETGPRIRSQKPAGWLPRTHHITSAGIIRDANVFAPL